MNLTRADTEKVAAWHQAAKESREATAAMEATEDGFGGFDSALVQACMKASDRHFYAVVAVLGSIANNCTCEPLPPKEES